MARHFSGKGPIEVFKDGGYVLAVIPDNDHAEHHVYALQQLLKEEPDVKVRRASRDQVVLENGGEYRFVSSKQLERTSKGRRIDGLDVLTWDGTIPILTWLILEPAVNYTEKNYGVTHVRVAPLGE